MFLVQIIDDYGNLTGAAYGLIGGKVFPWADQASDVGWTRVRMSQRNLDAYVGKALGDLAALKQFFAG